MSRSVDLLDRLVSFPTTPDCSNLALIDFVDDYLRERGFTVTRISDENAEKAGLVASIGPGEGRGILLSAHSDVVPVTGQDWTRSPFDLSEEAGRLYGRGTTDMKGFVASMLRLAERAADADLNEPLRLVLSYDEEIGCIGIRRMMAEIAPLIGKPRACIIGEPTNMQVAIGHKGKAALRALCHGEAGHSALAPRFVNALHVAADAISALRRVQDDLAKHGARDEAYTVPYSTVHVGQMSGGTALNIVPERAEILFEYRHLSADSRASMQARIDAALGGVPGRIEIEEINAYPGLDVAEGAEVVAMVKRLAQTNGVTKVAFGTEAGFFADLGLPTVVCGPGSMEGQGHKPDEYIDRAELMACDAMMDRILEEISS